MTLSLTDIQRLAGTAGFRAETLEKVLLLLDLLDAIRAHPFAGPRVVLKGGTALNLFALDIPRLSVDIDLNYIGAVDRATMEKERPLVDRDLRAACERTGVTVKRIPTEHAGGKWRLSFVAAAGGTGTLELDVNYILRAPLWPVDVRTPSAATCSTRSSSSSAGRSTRRSSVSLSSSTARRIVSTGARSLARRSRPRRQT